jgi:hypothetical protein
MAFVDNRLSQRPSQSLAARQRAWDGSFFASQNAHVPFIDRVVSILEHRGSERDQTFSER